MVQPTNRKPFRNTAEGFQIAIGRWVMSVVGSDSSSNVSCLPTDGMEVHIHSWQDAAEDSLQIDHDGTPSFYIESADTLLDIQKVLSRNLDREATANLVQSIVGKDMIRRGSVQVEV